MDGKITRLQKACDACNIRKVKCDASGPPCRSCMELDIPCTYDRPKKRRGPPNKHAEAIKKQKTESSTAAVAAPTPVAVPPPPPPPPPAPSNTILVSDSSSLDQSLPTLSGESICPLPTLQLLVDDYFLFIHPLIPVPHEPTFRQAFARREDVTNRRFLALLAAIIGSLVASFPRRPRLHLRTDSEGSLYPNSMALVKRCHDIAVQARGLGYLDTSTSIEDAAISYHLSLCSSYVYNIQRSRMYLGECMTILRVYNLYKPAKLAIIESTVTADASPMSRTQSHLGDMGEATENYLIQEQGRRLFYVCLAGFQTLHQLGSADGRIYIPPETPTDRYPPLPIEVDDEYLSMNGVEPQPVGVISQLTGFNANVRIFQCYNPLLALEIAFNNTELTSWDNQRKLIWESLQKAKSITAELPSELSLHHPQQGQELTPSMTGGWPPVYGDGVITRDQERRKIQYEIQKVNIYITQLSTRSYLVEKYWTLFEGHIKLQRTTLPASTENTPTILSPTQMADPNATSAVSAQYLIDESARSAPDAEIHAQTDQIGQMMMQERGLVIKDLLCLLKSVQEIHIEPNGASFTYKVRQIASTLLNLPQEVHTTFPTTIDPVTGTPATTTPPSTGPQPLSTADAEKYLRTFLDILVRLEGVGVTGGDPLQSSRNSLDASNNFNIKATDLDLNVNSDNNNSNMVNINSGNTVITALLNDPLVAAAAYLSPHQNDAYLHAMSYTGDGLTAEEEEELKQWTSLKEFQKTFVEDGGRLYSA